VTPELAPSVDLSMSLGSPRTPPECSMDRA